MDKVNSEPCSDAKEMGHGCYRAIEAESERNAAVARSNLLACALRSLLSKCTNCGGTGEVGTGIIQMGQPDQMPCFVCAGERQILLKECGK
jgi:hypothetical protein